MIIRSKLDRDYTSIPNAIIEDETLSAEARWLLIYLLSKPRDWVVRIGDIMRAGGFGRNKGYDLIKSLENAGYILKQQARDGGAFREVEYIVSDIQSPLPGLRDTDLRDTTNRDYSNNGKLPKTYSLVTSVTKAKDARDLLWEKVTDISSQTGIPDRRLRPMVGKWLKQLNDDAGGLTSLLVECLEHRPADFVSFVNGAVKAKSQTKAETSNWMDAWK